MNYIVNVICLLVLLILFVWIYMDMMINIKKKIGMCNCVFLTFIAIFSLIICQLVENKDPSFIPYSIIFNMIGFVVSPFIFMVEAHSFVDEMKKKHLVYFIPAIINALCALVSPMTKWIFYVSNNNQYFRGEYYYIYIFAFVFSIFYSWSRKMFKVSQLPSYFYKRILLSSFILFPCLSTQVFFPDLQISYMIITIHLLLYYGFSSQIAGLTDGLTGLLNRTAFNNFILNVDIKKKQKFAIVVVDVDGFKTLNDENGHLYGDICLKQIATLLKEVFNRRIFRVGGDEFVVLVKISNDQQIINILNTLEHKVEDIRKDKKDFPTISYGYDVYELGNDIQSVIHNADLRMYEHKKQKYNRT